MELIRNILNHDLNIEKYFPLNSCFMDIETTGLRRNSDLIYLVGIIYKQDDNWFLDQYFLNNMENEDILLSTIIESLNTFDTIITYNGDSFDIPFINSRAEKYNIKTLIDLNKSEDLYRYVKKNKIYLNLPNLKLKTIEESLGYFREDKYTGYDCIKFYKEYMINNDIQCKEFVLKHNFDDLYHMLDIVEIIDYISLKKQINFHFENIDNQLILNEIKFLKDKLFITGSIEKNLPFKIIDYNTNYDLLIDENNTFSLSLDTEKGYISPELLCNFINLNNFSLKIPHKTKYNIPKFIFPLKIDKDILFENITSLISTLLNNL